MDVDQDLSPKFRLLDPLDMSEWEVIEGFCAYAIGIQNSHELAQRDQTCQASKYKILTVSQRYRNVRLLLLLDLLQD